jgi:hypothetical protein
VGKVTGVIELNIAKQVHGHYRDQNAGQVVIERLVMVPLKERNISSFWKHPEGMKILFRKKLRAD